MQRPESGVLQSQRSIFETLFLTLLKNIRTAIIAIIQVFSWVIHMGAYGVHHQNCSGRYLTEYTYLLQL